MIDSNGLTTAEELSTLTTINTYDLYQWAACRHIAVSTLLIESINQSINQSIAITSSKESDRPINSSIDKQSKNDNDVKSKSVHWLVGLDLRWVYTDIEGDVEGDAEGALVGTSVPSTPRRKKPSNNTKEMCLDEGWLRMHDATRQRGRYGIQGD